jgi:hypothetical protein
MALFPHTVESFVLRQQPISIHPGAERLAVEDVSMATALLGIREHQMWAYTLQRKEAKGAEARDALQKAIRSLVARLVDVIPMGPHPDGTRFVRQAPRHSCAFNDLVFIYAREEPSLSIKKSIHVILKMPTHFVASGLTILHSLLNASKHILFSRTVFGGDAVLLRQTGSNFLMRARCSCQIAGVVVPNNRKLWARRADAWQVWPVAVWLCVSRASAWDRTHIDRHTNQSGAGSQAAETQSSLMIKESRKAV